MLYFTLFEIAGVKVIKFGYTFKQRPGCVF